MGEVSIVLATTAGFCFGVARAINICERLIESGTKAVTLGSIINNPQVVYELEKRGVRSISSPKDANDDELIVIRSHGVCPSIYEEIKSLKLEYIDASCIDVFKIHKIVEEGTQKGRITLIVGDKDHPEVMGILGYAKGSGYVFNSVDELEKQIFVQTGDVPAIMVAQTTFNLIQYNRFTEVAKRLFSDIEIHDTVCGAMLKRQKEAEIISANSDVCIVIGGRQSSNSKKLFEICSSNAVSYLVETKDELNVSMFKGKHKIAVTAGASTPTAVIEEVLSRMEELVKDNGDVIVESQENVSAEKEEELQPIEEEVLSDEVVVDIPEPEADKAESQPIVEESVETPKSEQDEEVSQLETEPIEEKTVEVSANESEQIKEAVEIPEAEEKLELEAEEVAEAEDITELSNEKISTDEEEFNFESALEGSLRPVRRNQRLSGVVTQIRPNEIVVDIGSKQTGIIPIEELSDDTSKKPEEIVSIGERINLFVINTNDAEGITTLSKKRIDSSDGLNIVTNAFEQGSSIDAFIVDVVNKGLIAIVKGVRIFIPASQATLRPGEKYENLLRTNVKIKILEVDPQRRRIIGSVRAVLFEEIGKIRDAFWETVEVDKEYTGKVKSLTNYGAFVDLGGVDGMVHVSELSWQRVRNPADVVSLGDEITVYIKSLDHEKRRISLGYRRDEDNPWKKFEEEYSVDDIFDATIVSLTQFGAFARILPGIDGLIHISEISDGHIDKASDVLSVGDQVSVKLLEVNVEKKRISLTMKYDGAPELEFKVKNSKEEVLKTEGEKEPEPIVEETIEQQVEEIIETAPEVEVTEEKEEIIEEANPTEESEEE